MPEVTREPHPGLPAGWMIGRVWRRGDRQYRAIEPGDLEYLRTWRNAQQVVLRQQQPLTPEHQEAWFRDVVAPSYRAPKPSALLVTVVQDGEPRAYGGLTNMEWVSRRAELSFLAASDRAADLPAYEDDFGDFLVWALAAAFEELDFNRVFTETWSFRVEHLGVLERAGMRKEGVMRQHVVKEGVAYDAVLHGITRQEWLQSHE